MGLEWELVVFLLTKHFKIPPVDAGVGRAPQRVGEFISPERINADFEMIGWGRKGFDGDTKACCCIPGMSGTS